MPPPAAKEGRWKVTGGEPPEPPDPQVAKASPPPPPSSSDSLEEGTPLLEKGTPRGFVPRLQLFGMVLFAFPLSLIWSSMGLVVLPAEALRFWPSNESIWLGAMLFVVGVSQLSCPIAGKMSDQCRCFLGKRQPFCVIGTATFVVFGLLMYHASITLRPTLYMIALFFGMLSMNVIYSAQAALVPDVVGDDQKGEASGMLGVCQFTGNIIGIGTFLFRSGADIYEVYPIYVIALVAVCVVVFFSARERSTANDPPPPPISAREIANSFTIDLKKERDFFWVFVGRTFYYIAVSCQVFIYYFLRDVIRTPSEALIRYRLAMIVVIAQFVAVAVAYPLGVLSDRVGRKILIYMACFAMSSTYIIFLLAPLAGSDYYAMVIVYAASAYYGLGSGCYLAVDYALALDCLPEDTRGASEVLGLWGISGFLGSAIGPIIGGILLEVFGNWGEGGHYSFNGYVWMHSMGIVAAFFAAYFTKFIQKAK